VVQEAPDKSGTSKIKHAWVSRRFQNEPALAQLNKAPIRENRHAHCDVETERSLRWIAEK
jgi:hypothetical protein